MTGAKSLEETKVDNIRPQVSLLVSPDRPGANVQASVGETDMDGWESLSNSKVDNMNVQNEEEPVAGS